MTLNGSAGPKKKTGIILRKMTITCWLYRGRNLARGFLFSPALKSMEIESNRKRVSGTLEDPEEFRREQKASLG